MKLLTRTQPILTVDLFPGLSDELVILLRSLSAEEWHLPTACAGWTVKDVAAHLLGGNVGRLSSQRDGYRLPPPGAAITSFDDLVAYINQLNDEWIRLSRRLSPALLIELIELTDREVGQFFSTLDPFLAAPISVAWAGEETSLNWFDVGREYTEKWLHQQHIREATGRPLLMERKWLHPVLELFLRALPYTYRGIPAPEGTRITFVIRGDGGSEWTLARQGSGWILWDGAQPGAQVEVELDQDCAWRLFTKGLDLDVAKSKVKVIGDRVLGEQILYLTAIMA